MALISDEHTSICPAIAAVDPSFTKWSACITHRKGNVVKRCGKVAGELFKKAAFAYTVEQYEKCKDEIKKFGNKLYEYCFGEYDDEERSRKASSAYAQRLHLSFQKICVLYYYKHIPPLSLCIKM